MKIKKYFWVIYLENWNIYPKVMKFENCFLNLLYHKDLYISKILKFLGPATSILVTDVSDQMYWWQVWEIGDKSWSLFYEKSELSNIGFCHKNAQSDAIRYSRLVPTFEPR